MPQRYPTCRGAALARLSLAVMTVGLLVWAPAVVRAADRLSEDEVKASYLYNFIQYVEWPVPYRDPATITICTVGRSPVNDLLESLDGRSVRSRRLAVHAHVRSENLNDCDLVFSSSGAKGPALPAIATGSPVLTVGDAKGFVTAGGMIGFVRSGDKVRFEINNRAAQRARLRISSHLLRLAVSVVE